MIVSSGKGGLRMEDAIAKELVAGLPERNVRLPSPGDMLTFTA